MHLAPGVSRQFSIALRRNEIGPETSGGRKAASTDPVEGGEEWSRHWRGCPPTKWTETLPGLFGTSPPHGDHRPRIPHRLHLPQRLADS